MVRTNSWAWSKTGIYTSILVRVRYSLILSRNKTSCVNKPLLDGGCISCSFMSSFLQLCNIVAFPSTLLQLYLTGQLFLEDFQIVSTHHPSHTWPPSIFCITSTYPVQEGFRHGQLSNFVLLPHILPECWELVGVNDVLKKYWNPFQTSCRNLFCFFWYILKTNCMCWDYWLVVSILSIYIGVCKMYGFDFSTRFYFLVAIWTVSARCNAHCLFPYYLSHNWFVCLLEFCLTSCDHLLICNPFVNVLLVVFCFASHSGVTQFLLWVSSAMWWNYAAASCLTLLWLLRFSHWCMPGKQMSQIIALTLFRNQ